MQKRIVQIGLLLASLVSFQGCNESTGPAKEDKLILPVAARISPTNLGCFGAVVNGVQTRVPCTSSDPLVYTFKGNKLTTGQSLSRGDYLTSPDGRYKLIMQYDGNLVAYRNFSPWTYYWNTSTDGGTQALMQTDGNFVVYAGSTALWYTRSWGLDGLHPHFDIQNDANMVVYYDGGWRWSAL